MPTFAEALRVLRLHVTPLLERLQWRLAGDARETRLVCLVSCVSSRNPELFRIVARDSELAAAVARDSKLAAAVARNPELAAAWAHNPEFAAAWARDPEFAAAVARNPELAAACARNRELAAAWARNPELAAAWARNPELAAAWARDPELAAACAHNPELAAACGRNPDLAAAWARNPELATAVARNSELAAAWARNPELATAWARDTELAAACARNPEFAAAWARDPELAAPWARNPEIAAAVARNPEFAAPWARNSELAAAVKWVRTHFLFGSDDANRCIKRLYSSTEQLAVAYKSASDTRVHNLLVPNAYDENDLLAIESKQISRQVGVLIRNETVYSLVRFTWHFKADSEEKEVWEVTWFAELYRVDIEPGAEARTTSLCRAGNYVLCAVALSNRLAAFEYTNRDAPLKSAGDYRFYNGIVHFDAFSSGAATGSLVAIAFTDESIHLYRQQLKETRLDLQETCRVLCEHVHKLLFAGDRLLVSARSDEEDEHSVWSCHVVGERLYGEGLVQLGSEISVESWCYDHTNNQIYCVDAATNTTYSVK